MTSNDKIAEGYAGSTASLARDERVAAGYQRTAMTDAIEELAKRDPDKLTPTMKMQLGYLEEARAASERVERGEAR